MNNTQNDPAVGCPLKRLVMRCYTCKYWQGNKAKVAADMAENPQCMDLFKGWPETGDCGIDYEWKELTIRGDATATLEVTANFGCPYWGA